jgi:hypothetical protein
MWNNFCGPFLMHLVDLYVVFEYKQMRVIIESLRIVISICVLFSIELSLVVNWNLFPVNIEDKYEEKK